MENPNKVNKVIKAEVEFLDQLALEQDNKEFDVYAELGLDDSYRVDLQH
jgi:hypothetical protein